MKSKLFVFVVYELNTFHFRQTYWADKGAVMDFFSRMGREVYSYAAAPSCGEILEV